MLGFDKDLLFLLHLYNHYEAGKGWVTWGNIFMKCLDRTIFKNTEGVVFFRN